MKKLAIIGASYLQEPIVKKAKQMGIYTICFAWADGATCAEICDKFYDISIIEKEQILEICKKEQIDGITTIASDTATLTVNYVASRMGLISNPDEYSEICTNKFKMRQCFMDADVPSPKFTLVDDEGKYSIKGFRFPLIVKPTDRSGSRGLRRYWILFNLNQPLKEQEKILLRVKPLLRSLLQVERSVLREFLLKVITPSCKSLIRLQQVHLSLWNWNIINHLHYLMR